MKVLRTAALKPRLRFVLAFALAISPALALAQSAKPDKGLVSAYLIALASDAATTNYNLEHGRNELNPLMRPWAGSRAGRIAGFSFSGAATLGAACLLQRRHPRAARILLIFETADHSAGAAWNLRFRP